MKVFKMPCNQLPIYCVHQSTPVKYIQGLSAHCPILDERRQKLDKEVDTDVVSNSGSFLNAPVESERVKEIQKKVDNLRKCNDLLIGHIRKLFDSSYRPTGEDLDYLQQLFEADQRNVQDLGESLTNVKLPDNSSSFSSETSNNGLSQTFPISSCANPCIRQWEECDYSAIKAPSPLPPLVPACIRQHASISQHYCQHQQQRRSCLQKQSGSFRETNNDGDKCCRRILGQCEHNKENESSLNNGDLLRMETELREIKKRVDKLTEPQSNNQNENVKKSDWSIISAAEEDHGKWTVEDQVDNLPSCKSIKCKKKSKCSCEAIGKAKKKFKCTIV